MRAASPTPLLIFLAFLIADPSPAQAQNSCSWWWEINDSTSNHHGSGPLDTYRPEVFRGAHSKGGARRTAPPAQLGPNCVIAYTSWSYLNTKDGHESFPDQGPMMKCEAGKVSGWNGTHYTKLECLRETQFARISRAIENNLCGIEQDDMDGCANGADLDDPTCKKSAQLWTETCALSHAGGMLCIVKNSLEVIKLVDKKMIDAVILEVDDKGGDFREHLPLYEEAVGAKKMYVAYYGNRKEEVCKYAKRGMHIIIKRNGRQLDGTDMDCCP